MAHLRLLIATHRRSLLSLVACAMLVRALVPVGWMPVASAQGLRLMLCDGTGPAVARPVAHAMQGMHHDDAPGHPSMPGADHPCAFAGIAPGIVAPALAAPLPPARVVATPPLARAPVAIGHGLAAPPPPPTGPPTFA